MNNLPGTTGKVFTLEFVEWFEKMCEYYIVSEPVLQEDGKWMYEIKEK